MGMFRTLFSTFFGDTIKTGIRVTYIHYVTGAIIEEQETEQEQLPEKFNDSVTHVSIYQKIWQIVKAEPDNAYQYSFDKKLTVWLKDPVEAMLKKEIQHPAENRIFFMNAVPGNNSTTNSRTSP